MRKLLIPFLIALTLPTALKVTAKEKVKINCDSIVYRETEQCKEENRWKETIDAETGLSVIEFDKDIDWKKRNVKLPWSKITKYKSSNGTEIFLSYINIDVNEDWLEYLDFCDSDKYKLLVEKFSPNYLFHIGAFTDLEFCEKNKSETFKTNTDSVKTAVKISNKLRFKLLYDSNSSLQKKIKLEQLRKEVK